MEGRLIIKAPTHWIGAAAITVWPIVLVSPRAGAGVLEHESVHLEQQRRWALYGLGVGLLAWFALYLFILPFGYNPWRRRWEREAFAAQGFTQDQADEMLRRAPYFLR